MLPHESAAGSDKAVEVFETKSRAIVQCWSRVLSDRNTLSLFLAQTSCCLSIFSKATRNVNKTRVE